MKAAQVKDEIRHMSLSDKIEIYKWLAGDIEDGLRRSLAICQETDRSRSLISAIAPKGDRGGEKAGLVSVQISH
jgi:hypothetical protein